jgi:hypothetical protein
MIDPKRVARRYMEAGALDKLKKVFKDVGEKLDEATGQSIAKAIDRANAGDDRFKEFLQKPGESTADYAARVEKGHAKAKKLLKDDGGGKKDPDLDKRYKKYKSELKNPDNAMPFGEWAMKNAMASRIAQRILADSDYKPPKRDHKTEKNFKDTKKETHEHQKKTEHSVKAPRKDIQPHEIFDPGSPHHNVKKLLDHGQEGEKETQKAEKKPGWDAARNLNKMLIETNEPDRK